jgi:abortive infection bacteriophage resistance protein
LKQRGLVIPDEAKARHLLENLSYYRLSGYWYPLLAEPKTNHQFKDSADFETAFQLYCFDRELRLLILREIEKLEIAVRAKMAYHCSHDLGVQWLISGENFTDPIKHARSISKLAVEVGQSDAEFVRAFSIKYSDPIPPSWIALEVCSFGTLSKLYENLMVGGTKRKIANYFGVADPVFISWLHTLVYLRNVCAHHSRLWNRVMKIKPVHPRKPIFQWLKNKDIKNNRAYFAFSIIQYLLRIINPKSSFSDKLQQLLEDYSNVNVRDMGFASDYKQEPLWKE